MKDLAIFHVVSIMSQSGIWRDIFDEPQASDIKEDMGGGGERGRRLSCHGNMFNY